MLCVCALCLSVCFECVFCALSVCFLCALSVCVCVCARACVLCVYALRVCFVCPLSVLGVCFVCFVCLFLVCLCSKFMCVCAVLWACLSVCSTFSEFDSWCAVSTMIQVLLGDVVYQAMFLMNKTHTEKKEEGVSECNFHSLVATSCPF